MSYQLNVNRDSAEWRAVAEGLRARIAELTEEALLPGTTEQARRDAVVRIDELRQLLYFGSGGFLPSPIVEGSY